MIAITIKVWTISCPNNTWKNNTWHIQHTLKYHITHLTQKITQKKETNPKKPQTNTEEILEQIQRSNGAQACEDSEFERNSKPKKTKEILEQTHKSDRSIVYPNPEFGKKFKKPKPILNEFWNKPRSRINQSLDKSRIRKKNLKTQINTKWILE